MYVEYSARVLTFNIALNMFTMLVILRRCIMYYIHIVVDVLAFKVKMYIVQSIYNLYSLYRLYRLYIDQHEVASLLYNLYSLY